MDIQSFISAIDGKDLVVTKVIQGMKSNHAYKNMQAEYDEEKLYLDYPEGSTQLDLKTISKINVKDENIIQVIIEAGELWISGVGNDSLHLPVDNIKAE